MRATVAGTGQGLVFLGGLAAINQAVPEGRRADVLSSFYVVIYLGVGVPVIGVGFLATRSACCLPSSTPPAPPPCCACSC